MPIIINGTSGISGVDGSAGTPAIQGTDTNTGVFYPAADTVGIAIGGAEQLRVDSTGNLRFNSGYGSAATAYGCRAWVNFNGTGTVAIRASGNVTSITDNGTGDYTVNFTTAMPDANYSTGWSAKYLLNTTRYGCSFQIASQATASVRVLTGDFGTGTPTAFDFELINIQVFR